MLSGTFLASCTKEELNIPQNVATVNFASGSYSIPKNSTNEVVVTLNLSLPLEADGTVVIDINGSSTALNSEYRTEPAASSGKITLQLLEGATEASFKVISADNFEDDKTIDFAISSASGAVVPDRTNLATTVLMKGIPEILTSVASVEDFGNVNNGAESAVKSYTVTATGITADINVVASDYYKVSLDNTTFSSNLTIDFAAANAGEVQVFVKFIPVTGDNKIINGTITHSSTGVQQKVVTLSGTESGNIIPTLFFSDDFDYGSTPGNLSMVGSNNWGVFSGSANKIPYILQGLSFGGYVGSGKGGAVTMQNGSGSREDVFRSFTEQNSGSVYTAQLVSLSAAGAGDFFMSMREGTSYMARLYAKDDGGKPALGISRSSATASYVPMALNYNTTYLVITKYDFTTKVASLFVFDGAIPATEPAAHASSTDGTAPAVLQNTIIRQNTVAPLSATIDGVRVANTWKKVLGL